MTKRNKTTSKEELIDAIERMKKRPEARKSAKNSNDWNDYLGNVLNIYPETDKAQGFWDDVRQGVSGKAVKPLPTLGDLYAAGVIGDYVNPKTKQKSYRGSNGRWVKVIRYNKSGKEIA